MTYNELYQQIIKKHSFLCVGLDSDLELIPEHLKSSKNPIFEFNKAIIDATASYAVAYKPNTAFYEAEGIHGWDQLEMTIRYIRGIYPDIMVIADAKRGDIGNTAKQYAKAFFEKMNCDAVTVSPYMGRDSIEPFLEYGGKWSIVLALTSNNSAADFETNIIVNENDESGMDTQLYKNVIRKTMTWGSKENTMFVVGATRPESLKEIREICPDHFLLIPGVGKQGGSVEEVAKYGLNSNCGLLINSSRGIIFADRTHRFAQAAEKEASNLALKMELLLKNI